MNYLVDTHIFLWSILLSKRIPKEIQNILTDPQHSILVSDVSFWEISIKYQLKKLDLNTISPYALPEIAGRAGYEILHLDTITVSSFYKLPKLKNKDPFDRMLVWQAIQEGLILVSKDSDFKMYEQYGLRVLW